MNKAVIIGRLTRDPEIRSTQTEKEVCTFTLAVDRNFKSKDGQKETDFINCVAWGKLAEIVAKNLTKGRLCAVTGRIQTRTYEGNDGKKKYITEIMVDDVQFLDKKESHPVDKPIEDNDFSPIDGNMDVPF
jgi:single-strand DNA-binding protein